MQASVVYIAPQEATDRKEAARVYAVVVAGLVAAITATVGLSDLLLIGRSLVQTGGLPQATPQEVGRIEIGEGERSDGLVGYHPGHSRVAPAPEEPKPRVPSEKLPSAKVGK